MSDEVFFDTEEKVLAHYGILRKSGRYPYGSGENPYQSHLDFLGYVDQLKKEGFTEKAIAEMLEFKSVAELRQLKSISKDKVRATDAATAFKLREKGLSPTAIGRKMGKSESSVRALLDPSLKEKGEILNTITTNLKDRISDGGYLDVGKGTELHLGISNIKMKTALKALQEEGYKIYYDKAPQLSGKETTLKVLGNPDSTFGDYLKNQDKLKSVASFSEDGGRSFKKIAPPKSVKSNRVGVRYAEEGGAAKDGVIELRRGVADLSLGDSRYAQVRIAVDGTHFLKGMAMYSDDIPDGVDMVFNTNKANTGNKLDAMKKIKQVDGQNDPDLPFGSIIRQKTYLDSKGKEQLSPLNIVGTQKTDFDGTDISTTGEEGGWSRWSQTLSSQMLSKQSPSFAKQQLDLTYKTKQAELEEINSLTNPVVKQELLKKFADGADSSAVHLKAAALPRTANHVILPINSLKDNEVYAPKYNNGERVVLIRHPHGGIFEIPELTVNNRNKEANRVMQNAQDAIGINSKVAERLSGADFDGDTVLVIPQGQGRFVKTAPPLKDLEGFDPRAAYPAYDGMKTIDGGVFKASTGEVEYGSKGPNGQGKQSEMGKVSNLITDMTIKDANQHEIARAVRHSMVVIDAEKHVLNYKQSAIDNGISELKAKYQKGPNAGADTLISLASSEKRDVLARKARPAAEGGPINPETGEKMWKYTGENYTVSKVNKRTGEVIEKIVYKKAPISTKMAETSDAFTLSSGTPIETVYAEHANKLKALANSARKGALEVKKEPRNRSAAEVYAKEVASLDAKLRIAESNSPLERAALSLAKTQVNVKRQAYPNLDKDQLKKVRTAAVTEARIRTGAKKQNIQFTENEWAAVQAHAISASKLKRIIDNADIDQVKELAMPRAQTGLSPAAVSRAKAMAAMGYTQAEIAQQLGVSASTINKAIG